MSPVVALISCRAVASKRTCERRCVIAYADDKCHDRLKLIADTGTGGALGAEGAREEPAVGLDIDA
jgi:hypothetical protein